MFKTSIVRSGLLLSIFLTTSPTFAQSEQCQNLFLDMSHQADMKLFCSRLGEMRQCMGSDTTGSLQQVMKQLTDLCVLDQKKQQEAAPARGQPGQAMPQRQPVPPAPAMRAAPAQRPMPAVATVSPQQAMANRAQILQQTSERLQQSLTRIQLAASTYRLLVDTAKDIGESYVEMRAGSALAYSSAQDDALADTRGYRKRESTNFVVYYKTGDITRAQTLLSDAEGSIALIKEKLGHFPSPEDHAGRKLPIYLSDSHANYVSFSKCPDGSIACVSRIGYSDGMISTMFMSPKSYSQGAKATERLASFRQTIQHELTHYTHFDMVTAATAGSFHHWFTEGLASYVAGETTDRMATLSLRKQSGKPLLSLSELNALESAHKDIFESADVGLIYAEGLSIFDMLSATRGAEATKAFIIDALQNENFDGALATVFAMSPLEFDHAWRRYEQENYSLVIPPSDDLSTSVASAFKPGAVGNASSASLAQTTSAPPSGSDRGTPNSLEDRDYDRAMTEFRQADYDSAGRHLAALIQDFPGGKYSGTAHFWLGNTLYAQRNFDQAIKEFRRALDYGARSDLAPDAWLSIANCQEALGQRNEAQASYARVVGYFPDSDAAKTARQKLASN